jgi:hypothetical protein
MTKQSSELIFRGIFFQHPTHAVHVALRMLGAGDEAVAQPQARRGAAIAEAIKKFGITDPERQRGVIVRPIPDR